MPSVLALVIDERPFAEGEVRPIAYHPGTDRELGKLGDGGSLYLIAIADRRTFLVAILEAPERARIKVGDTRPDGWYAPPNATPVTDITALARTFPIGRITRPVILDDDRERALREAIDDTDAPVHAARAAHADVVPPALDGPPLDRAARFLAAGHLVAAIGAVLDAWRVSHRPALADLIDRITRITPEHDRPLLDRIDADVAWHAALADEPDARMPQLLQNLGIGKPDQITARLAALATLDDPRIARRIAQIAPSLVGDTARCRALVRLVDRAREITTSEVVRACILDDGLVRPVRETRFGAPTPPTARDLAAIAAVEAQLAPLELPAQTERALIDAIGDHPDSDSARLIYADWLQERAHPRGEYIALSCDRTAGRLTPASARRLALLEDIPYLFGALDDLAVTPRRVRPRGLDEALTIYWSTTSPCWDNAAHAPLVRLLLHLELLGRPRPDRRPAITRFRRAAIRCLRD